MQSPFLSNIQKECATTYKALAFPYGSREKTPNDPNHSVFASTARASQTSPPMSAVKTAKKWKELDVSVATQVMKSILVAVIQKTFGATFHGICRDGGGEHDKKRRHDTSSGSVINDNGFCSHSKGFGSHKWLVNRMKKRLEFSSAETASPDMT